MTPTARWIIVVSTGILVYLFAQFVMQPTVQWYQRGCTLGDSFVLAVVAGPPTWSQYCAPKEQ
jgi:hypothetical protein